MKNKQGREALAIQTGGPSVADDTSAKTGGGGGNHNFGKRRNGPKTLIFWELGAEKGAGEQYQGKLFDTPDGENPGKKKTTSGHEEPGKRVNEQMTLQTPEKSRILTWNRTRGGFLSLVRRKEETETCFARTRRG